MQDFDCKLWPTKNNDNLNSNHHGFHWTPELHEFKFSFYDTKLG